MDSSQALGPQHEWRKGQKIKEESTAMTTKTVRSHSMIWFLKDACEQHDVKAQRI